MNALALRKAKPLPPLPRGEVFAPKVPFMGALRAQNTRNKAPSKERMTSRKSAQKFPGAEQAMKFYARLRQRVSRLAKPVIVKEDEEVEECKCTVCLRSEPKTSNRDVFAESKKLAELLNTLPQVDGPSVKSNKTSRPKRRLIPKPNVAVLHELGLCVECRVKCEICMPDVKKTWRFAVLGDDDFAEDLDNMIISDAAEAWI